ncbi:MAG: ATP-binding protein, partial [Clostridium sp.]
LDRLVEIFNVCWPMYAAMPAVLKSAVEKSYEDCGWNLITSRNRYNERVYPSFKDVSNNVKVIINSSEYDNENKGAYKGALLTRLESLTNGLNGMIFTGDEIREESLFDENVIVDLSRVGSTETKSLIMGMLVLKLQEYRMSSRALMNSELKHITVLEEAHNLLRRTSTEQSQEGSNLQGKSVEMLSNAIAEMRTYGEGFIIADQAPGLLDMSVIRNTNTKIIMRLPDKGDRELVGRAANLNDDQITELAKLPCGVGAVYQNEWVQPVLCKVDRFKTPDEGYSYTCSDLEIEDNSCEILLDFIMKREILKSEDVYNVDEVKNLVIKGRMDAKVKRGFLNYINSEKEEKFYAFRELLFDFLKAEEAIKASSTCDNIKEWVECVVKNLNPSIEKYGTDGISLVMLLLIYEQSLRDATYNDVLCSVKEVYERDGSVF